MESSSSNSVNPTPAWSGGSRNNSASAADPMAFFDLIMKSSQAMATQGTKSFDPVTSTSSPTATGDPYTAPTDDPSLHDGYDDSTSAYAPEIHTRQSPDTDQPSESSAPEEDVAAAVDFSEQEPTTEDNDDSPDQAALETAASASQQDQLLAAPDALTEGEQAELQQQASEEVATATEEKKDISPSGKIDTDQPLDTAEPSSETSLEKQSPSVQHTSESGEGKSQQPEDPAFAVTEEEAIAETVEADSGEKTGEIQAQEKGKIKLDAVEQTAEEAADAEIHLDTGESTQDETSDRQSKDRKTPSAESKNGKSVDVTEPTPTTSPDVSTVAAVAKASEALAAAASGGAASPTTGAGTNTPGNTTGVNNLASLLQRGFQKGSLQKAEGSQSPKLDPKQQIRLINRVARAVESTPPGQSIKIRLNPSELGQLKVEIKIENGNMTAKIEAENSATRQVLLENLPQLRERLAESNINVQQFEVELMGQQTPQDGSASTFADQSGGQSGSQTSGRQGVEGSSEEETASGKRETVNKDAERDSRNLNVTV